MNATAVHGNQPHVRVFAVFAWLAALTGMEIGMVYLRLEKPVLVTLLIISALLKAGIVALYFMHMKFEGRWLWGLLLPILLLACMFFFALFPDIVFGYWARAR